MPKTSPPASLAESSILVCVLGGEKSRSWGQLVPTIAGKTHVCRNQRPYQTLSGLRRSRGDSQFSTFAAQLSLIPL